MNDMVMFIDFKIEIIKRFLSCGIHWKEAEKMAEAYIVFLDEKMISRKITRKEV